MILPPNNECSLIQHIIKPSGHTVRLPCDSTGDLQIISWKGCTVERRDVGIIGVDVGLSTSETTRRRHRRRRCVSLTNLMKSTQTKAHSSFCSANGPAFYDNVILVYSNLMYFIIFLKKWANPGLFFVYFRSFQANITIFTTNMWKNVHPVYSAGIRTHDLWYVSLFP